MSKRRVLVVDDNLEMARTIADGLVDRGYEATAVGSGKEAISRLRAETIDAVVTDLRMPRVDGLELLAESRKLDPGRPVIVMTAYSAIETAVESIRQGAYHYLTKPFKQDELAIFLSRALDEAHLRREASTLKTALRTRFSVANIIGPSPAIEAVRERIRRVADAPRAGNHLRRNRHGEGSRRSCTSYGQPTRRPSLRFRELRGSSRVSLRKRAVRLRQGCLHRGPRERSGRPVRRGQRRLFVPETRLER